MHFKMFPAICDHHFLLFSQCFKKSSFILRVIKRRDSVLKITWCFTSKTSSTCISLWKSAIITRAVNPEESLTSGWTFLFSKHFNNSASSPSSAAVHIPLLKSSSSNVWDTEGLASLQEQQDSECSFSQILPSISNQVLLMVINLSGTCLSSFSHVVYSCQQSKLSF